MSEEENKRDHDVFMVAWTLANCLAILIAAYLGFSTGGFLLPDGLDFTLLGALRIAVAVMIVPVVTTYTLIAQLIGFKVFFRKLK